MHILLVHQYFLEKDQGGGSRFNQMCKTWEEEGYKTDVIAGMVHYNTGKKPEKYDGKFYVNEQYSNGINVHRCHVSQAYNVNFLGRLWGYFSFVFSGTYAGLFKCRKKYDIVLVTSPPLFVGIIGYILSRFKNIPLVFEVRDLWPESAIDTGVLKNKLLIKASYWFERFIYKKSKLINTLTPAFEEKLHIEKNIPKEKLIMIPNAADFTLSDRISSTFDRDKFREKQGFDDKLVIIYIGAHGIANHLIQLVKAAEQLQDKPVYFICLGDGMERKQLIREVENRKLQNIKFHGSVSKEDAFRFILASDIGTAVLKNVETFKTIYSNKTFDYMACGKPIILGIDGVSKELVEMARCGIHVGPENPDGIVKAVKFYLKNPNLITEHGQNGHDYAHLHFDREILAKKYLNNLLGQVKHS